MWTFSLDLLKLLCVSCGLLRAEWFSKLFWSAEKGSHPPKDQRDSCCRPLRDTLRTEILFSYMISENLHG